MSHRRARRTNHAAGGPTPSDSAELLARWRPALEPFLRALARREQQQHAARYLTGLLSPLPHKSTETIAYYFHQPRHGLQHFLGVSAWDWSGLLDQLAARVDAALAESDGMVSFHLVGFPKKGAASVGVERQASGLGQVPENQQLAVSLGYASRKGAAVIDTALYLPPSWARDRDRCRRCGVPPRLSYRRFGQLAIDLLGRLGTRLPHAWVVLDATLGGLAELRVALRDIGTTYLAAIPASALIRPLEAERPLRSFVSAGEVGASLSGSAWAPTQAGRRVLEVTALPVVTPVTRRAQQRETLVRISPSHPLSPGTEYYLSNATPELPAEEWQRAAGSLPQTMDYLRRAMASVALSSYEVRTWAGWHHHQALALVAAWVLQQG